MLRSFKIGGIHPPGNKISKNSPITVAPLPDRVVVPLSQHIGAPATPCVAKGDHVRVGQLIGQSSGFVSANVHSPISGVVTAVDSLPDGAGLRKPAIVIEREGDEWLETIDRSDALIQSCHLTPKEIIDKIAAAGLVGMGGATFPAHVKLSIPAGQKAECLIINGVECEPYLTSDYRTMLERGSEVLVGVQILCKALDVNKAYIGIEDNKPEAISHLTTLAAGYPHIEIVPLRTKYPQGGEKQLIQAITGKAVPSGGLPIHVGVVVQNIGTALAVYEAVQKNKPLIERVVTVTGKTLRDPSNFMVRIGTPISSLIELCGGMPQDALKVINGGPMMGRALANIDAPVTKGTSGIVIMRNRESLRTPASSCIKCAKCVGVCPMGLEPYLLNKLTRLKRFDDLEPLRITDCIECGSCAYTCPASIPLLDYIRVGKAETMKRIRARKNC